MHAQQTGEPLANEDLQRLAHDVAENATQRSWTGYVPAKTAARDALMRVSSRSALEAEKLVDTMEMRGLLKFHRVGPRCLIVAPGAGEAGRD